MSTCTPFPAPEDSEIVHKCLRGIVLEFHTKTSRCCCRCLLKSGPCGPLFVPSPAAASLLGLIYHHPAHPTQSSLDRREARQRPLSHHSELLQLLTLLSSRQLLSATWQPEPSLASESPTFTLPPMLHCAHTDPLSSADDMLTKLSVLMSSVGDRGEHSAHDHRWLRLSASALPPLSAAHSRIRYTPEQHLVDRNILSLLPPGLLIRANTSKPTPSQRSSNPAQAPTARPSLSGSCGTPTNQLGAFHLFSKGGLTHYGSPQELGRSGTPERANWLDTHNMGDPVRQGVQGYPDILR